MTLDGAELPAACSAPSGLLANSSKSPAPAVGISPFVFPFGLPLQPLPCLRLSRSPPGAGEPWGCQQEQAPSSAPSSGCHTSRALRVPLASALGARGCSQSSGGRGGCCGDLVPLMTCLGWTGSYWGAAGWAALGSPRCFFPRWERGAVSAPSRPAWRGALLPAGASPWQELALGDRWWW